jgi:endonuclease/exonuclease/phosphatase (EEP) superfamily protein YafD
VSLSFAVALVAVYWSRPLATEAVTVWPSWIWAVPGLLFVLDGKRFWETFRWPLLAWSFLGIGFSEAWRLVLPKRSEPGHVRVVTLNTGGDMEGALREVSKQHADIVLIQESAPLENEAASIRRLLGKDFTGVIGRDNSVFVKGDVLESHEPSTNLTFARVRLKDGRVVEVASVRMQAPRARLDYWNADCWRAYSEHRTEHLEELRGIWDRVERTRGDAPLVLGGDFNLVPDAEEVRIFGHSLVDSYAAAGRGWYATAIAGTPLFRIDKVWASRKLVPIGTSSYPSEVSDHRFVVADFEWDE